jgi:hypothetical protein
MVTHGAVPPLGSSFLEQMLTGGAVRWICKVLTALMTAGLSGAVPRSHNGGHTLRLKRKEEASYDAMVASLVVSLKFMMILSMKIAWRQRVHEVLVKSPLHRTSALISLIGRHRDTI